MQQIFIKTCFDGWAEIVIYNWRFLATFMSGAIVVLLLLMALVSNCFYV